MSDPELNESSTTAASLVPVWYATEKKLKSPFKMWLQDDRGRLEILPGGLRFRGMSTSLDCREVQRLDLLRQTVPWLWYGISNALMLGMVYGGLMSTLTPDNPWTFVVLLAVNVWMFAVLGPARWIQVEYIDNDGQLRRAYFADGSFARVLGGTTRLYHQLRATLLEDQAKGEV